MRVAEKLECDPNCHRGSGCSERGEGKCDSYCVTGFGLDPTTYTCMGECDLVARCCSFVDELPSLINKTKPEQILVLFQFYSSLCTPLDSTGWVRTVGHRLITIILSNLKRFQKCFHGRFLGKFLVMLILKITPHLAYVTALPCETLMLILISAKEKN